jgi:hypothetical protein
MNDGKKYQVSDNGGYVLPGAKQVLKTSNNNYIYEAKTKHLMVILQMKSSFKT